jgi:uncharacterized protein YbjT (DUF2867 family)
MSILVTGGTGTLGRPTIALLRQVGHDVRVLSRTPGADRVVGDLTTGRGLAEAVAGVDTVLHLATTAGPKDREQTRHVVEASRAAGVTHLVFPSIVGVDRIGYPYYRAKFASEQVIEQSGVPFTILRATQFHEFIARLIEAQRRLPVLFCLDIPDQPIAATEVAERLVELVDAGPSGRVPDIGGPEQRPLRDLMRQWQTAAGDRRPLWTLPLAGRTIAQFRAGLHETALPGFGRQTFGELVAERARGTNKA